MDYRNKIAHKGQPDYAPTQVAWEEKKPEGWRFITKEEYDVLAGINHEKAVDPFAVWYWYPESLAGDVDNTEWIQGDGSCCWLPQFWYIIKGEVWETVMDSTLGGKDGRG